MFVAVPLGDRALAAVRTLVDEVAGDPRLPEAGRLRWVVTDNLHLTMRFLGAMPPDRVPDVAAAAVAAAASSGPFEVRLAGAGAYPSASRPRVVWLGLAAGAPDLAALASTLGDELAARGWERDDRPFRAHLTVARADGIPGAARAVVALQDAAAGLATAWTVDRLVVYESELGHRPVRYRPLATAILGGTGLPDVPSLR